MTRKGIKIRIRRYTFSPGLYGKFIRIAPYAWPQWSAWFVPGR
jgi:hypothetical protein